MTKVSGGKKGDLLPTIFSSNTAPQAQSKKEN
jgi:hypothetical protein